MKPLFTFLLLAACLCSTAQVQFVDPNFKQQVLYSNINSNHDNEIQFDEAVAAQNMSLSSGSCISCITSLVDVYQFPNLKRLSLNGGISFDVQLSNLPSLERLSVSGCFSPLIDLTGCSNLSFIQITNLGSSTDRPLQVLKLNSCPKLFSVLIDGLGIDSLDLSNKESLEQIILSSNYLLHMNLSGCRKLRALNLTASNIPSLDLSDCINLSGFYIYADSLRYLNMKNGAAEAIGYLNSAYPLNVCTDDFETETVKQYLLTHGQLTPNVSAYCSFTPGGNYNTIQGKIRLDANLNGCDNSDNGLPRISIKLSDSTSNTAISYSDANGAYTHYQNKGRFTVTPQFAHNYFTITPDSATVILDTAASIIRTVNFCVIPDGVHNDAEISITPSWPPARPGFNAGYTIHYKNNGNTTLSGNINLNFDATRVNFVSATQTVSAQSAAQLVWSYNNLKPFESRQITVEFNLLPPPVNNIGDQLNYMVDITPAANDETPADNSYVLTQLIRGSYDPNDKQCLEGNEIGIEKISSDLHYQIRFQNEGTDTAFNVVVVDNLSHQYNWGSFELTGASHPCSVKRTNNKLEFFFPNIDLPAKSVNEPASHGYINFKVKPITTTVIGDSLNNAAAIYFDFNLPVTTNIATTVVKTTIVLAVGIEYCSINAGADQNTVHWKASCRSGSAQFTIERGTDGIHFTPIHSFIASNRQCTMPFSYTDHHSLPGKNFYRIKITGTEGSSIYSKILLAENNRLNTQIVAVANNNIYVASQKQQPVLVKITGMDGKELYNTHSTLVQGSNTISFTIPSQAHGAYMLMLYTNDGKILTKKIVQ